MSRIPELPAPKATVIPTSVEQASEQSPSSMQYLTFWGCVCFEEIYTRSYRYTYSLLYRDHRFSPDSIEDALQVAYLKLWQRLAENPALLAEYSLAWLGKFIFNAAFYTRHRERTLLNRQQSPLLKDDRGENLNPLELGSRSNRKHSHESRQTDKRIDLEWAIVETANTILQLPSGKEQDRQLWALYGITALQVQVTEASQLFRVNHHSMKAAYMAVQRKLQANLKNYAPQSETRPIHNRGRKENPYQDIRQIRLQNANSPPENFEEVRKKLQKTKPDTLERDLLALEGIKARIPARQQARTYQLSYSAMQRAYERVHLLLAAVENKTVSPRQVEKKRAPKYIFQPEDEPFIKILANELLAQSKCQERLVALYAYLCNLPHRTTACNFQMNEATLRRYRQQVHERLLQLRHEAKNIPFIASEKEIMATIFEDEALSDKFSVTEFSS